MLPVARIVQRCPADQLMGVYKIPGFEGAEGLLQEIAMARGKLLPGGLPNIDAAARIVLQVTRLTQYYRSKSISSCQPVNSASVRCWHHALEGLVLSCGEHVKTRYFTGFVVCTACSEKQSMQA